MRSEDTDRAEAAAESAGAADASSSTTETGQPPAAESGPPAPEGGNVADELASTRDRYLRLAAEYDNYRKRTERERVEGRDRAQGQIVERLLESLDDLQRVAQADAASTAVEPLLEGIRMIERKIFRALEAEGLEVMDAKGQPFDPSLHEAIVMAPTAEAAEDHTVGEIFQPGYRFRGNLLRPARVQVRRHEG